MMVSLFRKSESEPTRMTPSERRDKVIDREKARHREVVRDAQEGSARIERLVREMQGGQHVDIKIRE